MRNLTLVTALGFMIVFAPSAERAAVPAQDRDHGISQADLQGTFAAKSIGYTTVCTNIGGCAAIAPTLLVKNFAAVAQATFNDIGNFCGTATSTNAPAAGSSSAVNVSTRTIAGSVTTLDSVSGQADVSFSIYDGGSCNGANFESNGAVKTTDGTAHMVVSDSGNRVDAIVTSYVGTAGQFGSVVNTLVLTKQTKDEGRRER